eukprot:gene4893-5975_t
MEHDLDFLADSQLADAAAASETSAPDVKALMKQVTDLQSIKQHLLAQIATRGEKLERLNAYNLDMARLLGKLLIESDTDLRGALHYSERQKEAERGIQYKELRRKVLDLDAIASGMQECGWLGGVPPPSLAKLKEGVSQLEELALDAERVHAEELQARPQLCRWQVQLNTMRQARRREQCRWQVQLNTVQQARRREQCRWQVQLNTTDFPAAAMPSDSGAGASQVAASSREPAAGEVGAVRDGVVVEAAGTSGAAGGPRHSKGSEGGAAPAGAGNNFWEVLPDPVAQQELKQALDIPAFAEVGRVLHKMLTEGGKKRGSLLTAAAILSFLPEQMQTPPWREAVGAALAQMVNSQIDQRPQSKQSEQSLSEPKEMDDLGFIRTYFRSASLAPSDADLVGASQLVVGYLEQTTEVPMLLARITYDPTRDNDTTDDLTTYDDNTLTVDAMTQNFPGGYEAGAYLPQDPASLYYRAANMGTLLSEETADGVMMHVQPIMMPEGNGCMTHGNCYGVVAYVGSEDTIPENMTEIVDAICQEIRNTVIMVGTRLEGLISERTAKATLSANRGSMILDKRQRWAMQKVDAVTALLSDFRSNQLSPEEQEEYSRLMDGMKGDGPDEAQLQRKAKNMVKILNLLPEWRAVCADVTEGMQAKLRLENARALETASPAVLFSPSTPTDFTEDMLKAYAVHRAMSTLTQIRLLAPPKLVLKFNGTMSTMEEISTQTDEATPALASPLGAAHYDAACAVQLNMVRQVRRREQCRWQVQLNTVRQARLGKRVWPLQCMQLHLGLERRREQCRWQVQLNTVRQARRREQCRWQVQLNTMRQARRREQCRWQSQAEHIFLHHAQLNTCLSEVRKCNVMSRVSVAAFCATLIILGDEELLEEPGINGGQLTSNDNGIKGIWKRCRLLLKKTVIVNERNYKQTTNLLDSMQMFSPQGAKITPAAMKAVEQLQAVAVTALSGGRTVSVSNVIKAVTVALTEWNTAIHNILVARDLKLAIEEDVKRQYERKE